MADERQTIDARAAVNFVVSRRAKTRPASKRARRLPPSGSALIGVRSEQDQPTVTVAFRRRVL